MRENYESCCCFFIVAIYPKNTMLVTDDDQQADILILNTCSVMLRSRKIFHQLGRWRSLKQKNSNIG